MTTDSLVGRTLGGYRLVTQLGSGGMGAVYFAEHLVMGRRAAIKALHAHIAHDQDAVSRFLTEARAANDIRHPNVVQITDIGQQDGVWFIVMELLEGETLGERLESAGACDERSALRIARQVASALGAAHERGIVHRDLKPENIFLTNHPDYPDYVKLLDFGIAKLLRDQGPGDRARTAVGSLLGTPAYMSPEQCRGQLELDHRSDIYSLGVVLYEMLTGRPPFVGATFGPIVLAHVLDKPKPPREVVRSLAPWLDRTIMRMLEKDPALRFASMAELRAALEEPRPELPDARELIVAHDGQDLQGAQGAKDAKDTKNATVSSPRPVSAQAKAEAQKREAKTIVDKLTEIIVGRIASDRLALPAMPGVVMDCLSASRDPKQTFASVAAVASRDPLLAPRILKLANSAAFPSRAPAVTLEQAIARIGIEGLTVALVEFSVEEVFTSRDERIRRAFNGIWEHSLATALIAKDLAQLMVTAGPAESLDPNNAYLGGLLHDVGKPVVAALLLEAERAVAAEHNMRWLDDAVWKRVVDGCHRTVGTMLAQRWNLSADIAAAIANSQDYDTATPRSGPNVVRLANALAKREGLYLGDVDDRAIYDALGAGRVLLGLQASDLDKACRALIARVGTLVDVPRPKPRTMPPTSANA